MPRHRFAGHGERQREVPGPFPNQASIIRLNEAMLFKQDDDWKTSSRYLQVGVIRPDRQGGVRHHSWVFDSLIILRRPWRRDSRAPAVERHAKPFGPADK